MEDNQTSRQQPDQLNPGQKDQSGEEVTIKKNEGISDQGNEWSDKEGFSEEESQVLGQKAEKYIKETADIEDLPGEEDEEEKEKVFNKEANASVVDDDDGENEDEVIESNEDYVPGFDLGRNKVQ